MSQRASGRERIERDCYETPAWVTEALLPHLWGGPSGLVWEPACGSGKMVAALTGAGHEVIGTDIATGHDFLTTPLGRPYRAIITNPPYTHATEFIERALALMPPDGIVAMLLRTDFDHAKTRRHLFGGCPAFARKLVLMRRIRWFEGSTGSPSFNHAWYVWWAEYRGLPRLLYCE